MSKNSRPAEKISPLEIPIEGVTPSAILAKLYRLALNGYGIEINRFNYLLEQFLVTEKVSSVLTLMNMMSQDILQRILK